MSALPNETRPVAEAATALPPCPNCGTPLAAITPPARYCPGCGQETRLRAPTLGEFVQQFGGAWFATEGGLWRTLKALAVPGRLTREYFAGRRRRYVLPLRLYLSVSLVVLLALRVFAGVQMGDPSRPAVVLDGPAERPASVTLDLGSGRAGLKDGRFFCEGLPGWLCTRLKRRLDHDPAGLAREAQAAGERFMANLGAAMFVLLPAYAAALKLVYRSRRLRYTEHLVFALHVHAFGFAMLGVTLLPLGGWEGLALLAVPVYTLLAMKHVYGGRWRWLLPRAALIAVVYGCAALLAVAGLGLAALLA